MNIQNIKSVIGAILYTLSCYYLFVDERLMERPMQSILICFYTFLCWLCLLDIYRSKPKSNVSFNYTVAESSDGLDSTHDNTD